MRTGQRGEEGQDLWEWMRRQPWRCDRQGGEGRGTQDKMKKQMTRWPLGQIPLASLRRDRGEPTLMQFLPIETGFSYTQCPPPHHCSHRQTTGHHPIWHHSGQQLPKKHRTKGIPHGRAPSAVAYQEGASSNQKPRLLGNKASPEIKSTYKQECNRE